MNLITMPTPSSLRMTSVSLELQAALGTDCRFGLINLWSLAVDHGNGPYRPLAVEIACEWRGPSGQFVEALIDADCLDRHADGSVSIRSWQDVIGYVEPAPVNETTQERARRLARERLRRHRQSKKEQAEQRFIGNGSETVLKRSETVGNGFETVGNGFGNAFETLDAPKPTPSRTRSLSLISSSQKEQEPEAEAEEENVGSIAFAPVTPASPAGIGAAPRSTPREGTDGRLPFALTPPDATDRTTAIGQERPVVGSGSTIGAEVRSAPVPASDRASESNSGGPAKKPRGGKKAAVDPQAVAEPVRQVWNAYAEVVGTRVVLSQERAALIAARLSDGWTAEELIEAVRGFGKSKWHFGANKDGTRYTSIELWLRDAQHVEQGLGFHKEAAKAAVDPAEALKHPPRTGIEDRFKAYFAKHGNKVVF